MSRPVEGCVSAGRLQGFAIEIWTILVEIVQIHIAISATGSSSVRAAEARSASPLSAEILPAQARKSPQISEVLRLHRCGTTALPFNIKSASVGEGQPRSPCRGWRTMASEELRVLLAHSMRTGHHHLPRPGGMTRLDPVG